MPGSANLNIMMKAARKAAHQAACGSNMSTYGKADAMYRADGLAEVYIDGVRRGWMQGYEHKLTWNPEEMTINLGQRYTGKIDEVLILDTALDAAQVEELHRLPGSAGALL